MRLVRRLRRVLLATAQRKLLLIPAFLNLARFQFAQALFGCGHIRLIHPAPVQRSDSLPVTQAARRVGPIARFVHWDKCLMQTAAVRRLPSLYFRESSTPIAGQARRHQLEAHVRLRVQLILGGRERSTAEHAAFTDLKGVSLGWR